MADPAVARHFAASAESYGRLRGRGPLGWIRKQEQQAVRELADVAPGERVLDAGCGDGVTLGWLQSRGAQATGIDLSWPMARVCDAAGCRVAVQDLERPGLRAVFDWVLCIGAMEFVADPAGALRRLAECLAPGGRLVLLYPRRGALGSLYSLYHRSHGARIHTFDRRQVTELMNGAGLETPEIWRDCVLATVCRTSLASPDRP
jgi:SAM-dependent methyltransferase